MKIRKNKLGERLKYHLVDSTALAAISTPYFAGVEVFRAGFSDEQSLNARLFAAGLLYCGMGSVVSKGRDISRNLFRITEKTKGKKQFLHDTLYMGAFNLAFSPIFYISIGAQNFEQIAVGTIGGIAYGLASGAILGASIDISRDLTGLEDCERRFYPKAVKNFKSKAKKAVAGGLVAGCIGWTQFFYQVSNNPQAQEPKSQKIGMESLERKISL